ncbi:MAG: hypothetical protein ACR2F6_01755 [Mycobacteriales bacterium]
MNEHSCTGDDPYAWVYLVVLGLAGAAMTVVGIVEFVGTTHWQFLAFALVGIFGLVAAYHIGTQIAARRAARTADDDPAEHPGTPPAGARKTPAAAPPRTRLPRP